MQHPRTGVTDAHPIKPMPLDIHYCSAVAGARDPKGVLVNVGAACGRVDDTRVAMAPHATVKPRLSRHVCLHAGVHHAATCYGSVRCVCGLRRSGMMQTHGNVVVFVRMCVCVRMCA